jgi:hypothetical protein
MAVKVMTILIADIGSVACFDPAQGSCALWVLKIGQPRRDLASAYFACP